MWLTAEFEAVSLFSLKPSNATSSGGKTLLAPSPFSVKMALLDAACRTRGRTDAEGRWTDIRALSVALRPAANAVVSNTFQRVLRPYKAIPSPDSPKYDGPFQRTIGYREYAHFQGAFALALGWKGEDPRDWLIELLYQINYLGKRGGFIQLLAAPLQANSLPDTFVQLSEETMPFLIDGTLQLLDDSAPGLSFEKVDVYDDAKMRAIDRVVRHVVLPYRLKRASRSFTWYELITPGSGAPDG